MKTKFLQFSLLVLFVPFLAQAQDTVGVMANPQVKAKFPGGDAALQCYFDTVLPSSIVSVPTAKGFVFVRYQIDLEGKIVDFNIMKHISPEIDSAISQAYARMPRWTPATHQGKTVYNYQSYSFKLPYVRKKCGLPEPINKKGK